MISFIGYLILSRSSSSLMLSGLCQHSIHPTGAVRDHAYALTLLRAHKIRLWLVSYTDKLSARDPVRHAVHKSDQYRIANADLCAFDPAGIRARLQSSIPGRHARTPFQGRPRSVWTLPSSKCIHPTSSMNTSHLAASRVLFSVF